MGARLLFALTVAAAAEAAPLDREVESVRVDAEDLLDMAPRAPLDRLLACAAETEEEEEAAWSFDLTGYWVHPPEDDDYGSAILRADHGALHLEARYNYEDIDTGSVWAGWTFSWSGAVEFSLVPMAGVVFGHTRGAAPGLELDLVWKVLEFYTEAEYVFDFDDGEDSFFYLWSELTVNPTEWLSFGLVAQRTRAFQTDLEVDRGLLLGFHVGKVSATVYVFDFDRDDPYVMVGVGITF